MTAFPDDFLWGASSAPHQNEGNNTNSDMWALEQLPGSSFAERSGDGLDFYHRWREDIDLLKSLGLSAFRFGIEWARVEPVRGHVARAELGHYRRIIEYCLEVGVEPVVTLHHFSSPLWFVQAGGWASEEAVDRFGDYVTAVAPILDGVTWVATINEPNMFAVMHQMSTPLQYDDPQAVLARMREAASPVSGEAGINAFTMPEPKPAATAVMIRAHERAREILHDLTSVEVGWTIAVQGLVARSGHEEDLARYRHTWEGAYLEVSREDDWVGVQSYTSQLVGPDGLEGAPDGAELTQVGWAYRPDALEMALRQTWQATGGTPMLITENGIATTDDARRIDYTTGALEGVASAIADGLDVRGYLHWTFVDNFEWVHGYDVTFGLVAVDLVTFDRTPKPSARWLGRVARANALPAVAGS
ncbi:glycoside hydrolase family 1 protein [Frigoribacterium sp. PhB24]|uniref:glycoside hydrolase family 1 protein n=1 Tax=Frigoribacterium sp. PhB24 TaxID=2485204 RepID=UPI000F4853AC|nr:family 1 glycosylhydrolase [Frigoribacterium sp. PhB24]ROS48911.1 beta-glucosidase [Frigoribacterium sp. PhB24]